jgi:phosphoribosylamine--glycine ligase
VGDSFQQAHERVYGAVEKITFDGAHYRRDIGKRVIDAG